MVSTVPEGGIPQLHFSARNDNGFTINQGFRVLSSVPFPEVFVINLDNRRDRWEAIEQICRDSGLVPVRISAVHASPGWIGCGLSHLSVIDIAKEKRLPWVLILEDDAAFDPECIARFRLILPYLWDTRGKWERFSGGPHLPFDPEVRIFDVHHQLMYIDKGRATHFD